MSQTRVGVIRGGLSDEYEVSLKTGAAVLRNMPERCLPVDILIDRAGVWHLRGLPRSPGRIADEVDVIFNALHGYYGEDGAVQRILDNLGIPYTGSGALASELGMGKARAKEVFLAHGIKTPRFSVVRRGDDVSVEANRLFRSFAQPSVVKPDDGGSSLGVHIVRDYPSLAHALEETLRMSRAALVEEYITGREATCGVLDRFRGEAQYALPPIEIIPPPSYGFFDYDAKYTGVTQELCPSPYFTPDEKREIMRSAIAAHRALGLRHYSRSDFIVSPRGIYILEVNTLPGLTEESLFPKACKAVGCSFPRLIDHLLTLAMSEK
ncbi:MAG: D-alanine--D-alanine ligase [Parcubacteria group bacterium]|nr:D-alanine--D-alanine ligase [Parcubacteria group bacterium]